MSRKSRGKLKSEHEYAIRDNYVYLQEELQPLSIADYLYERGIFDKDDLEEVRCCKTRKEQATKLIDKIQHAGPQDAYEMFVQSLEREQRHITYRLLKSIHDWQQIVRSQASPEAVSQDVGQGESSDPLLLELERLNDVIDNLKKENDQLKEENRKLTQNIATEVKEKENLMQRNIHLQWEESKRFAAYSFTEHRCCEREEGACSRQICKLCGTKARQMNILQFETETDQILEKLLQCVPVDPLNATWQEFFVFIACGNLEKSLKVLMDKGMGVNVYAALTRNVFFLEYVFPTCYKTFQYRYEGLVSPLMAAASNGSNKALKLLLDAGADVNATDVLGDTALIYLCRSTNLAHPLYLTLDLRETSLYSCFDALISHGADIDAKGKAGMTALMHLAKNGNNDFAYQLLEKMPDTSIVCDEGKTALMHACSYHSFPESLSIEMFINACNKNARDQNGNTALMHCLLAKNIDPFFQLLDYNADVNIQNNAGDSPLVLAVKLKMEDVVKRLAEYEFRSAPMNINLQDSKGDTALILATKLLPSVADDLLPVEGIDVNVQNSEGETALMTAAINFELDLVKKLVDAGADVNVRDNSGRSILKRVRTSKVNSYGQKETVQYLIAAGATE